jgi:hypothetical protein
VTPIIGSTGRVCALHDEKVPTTPLAGAEVIARALRSALADSRPMIDTLHYHGSIPRVERRKQPEVSEAELVLIG